MSDSRSAAALLQECLRLARIRRTEDAEKLCNSALQRFPSSIELRVFLSRILLSRKDFAGAYEALSPSIREGTYRSDYYYNLGLALKGLGRLAEAARWIGNAADLDPDVGLLKSKLGQVQLMLFETEEAERNLSFAHRKDPTDVPTMVNLAHAKAELGEYVEAQRLLDLASNSGQVPALIALQKGSLAELLGDYDAAAARFQEAIQADPNLVMARVGLAYSRKAVDRDDPNLHALEALSQSSGVEELDRGLAHYAIAKSLEDLKEYGEAAPHYDAANVLFLERQDRLGKRFEEEEYRERCKRLADYPASIPSHFLEVAKSDSRRPVFVVGMIRSGTTLVEQMLGRHPDIAPGGEIPFWTSVGAQILQGKGERAEFLRDAVKTYLERLDKVSSTAPRVVDKMPTNYHLLGLLLELFPNATFIHCKRNAVDTAISIYTTKYKGSPDFGHSRRNIVTGYLTYLDLMKKVLAERSPDRLIEIQYETLVQDPGSEMGRLLDFIGVKWDPIVLEPEKSTQAVATPSSWQVRQPIYSSSISRSARFPEWLPDFEPLSSLSAPK